jgi:CheY-like chemotaxis protein
MMGGRIWVESEAGQGSVFHFTAGFDLAEVAEEDRPVEPLLVDLPVLIVDDNPVNRRILQAQLARWQTWPTAVESGRAALEALKVAAEAGRPYVLVLLDVNMPELDGFQVAEQILGRPELAEATIMMLSSSGHYGDTARSKALGVSAYLTKPIQAPDLYEAICRVLTDPAKVRPTRRAAARPAPARPAVRALRVLLAEDNVVNQRVAVGLLGKRGHAVTVANNGAEALEFLERGEFDLILMDLQMPVMGGFEATKKIRERERQDGGHARIVAMTAHALNGDRERCLAAGMDGYLAKPIDPVMLFSTVEQEASAGPAPEKPQSCGAIDREQMMERLGGDEVLFQDVIQVFLADCPVRLAAIKAAIDSGDAEEIRRTSHALKGAAGNLSANGLFEAARTLERLGAENRIEAARAAWRTLSVEAAAVIDALRRYETTSPAAPVLCAV